MGAILATDLNLVGKLIYNVLFKWVSTWASGSELFGTFAVTVIMFTLFLKLATLPLDLWQKTVTRKNARKMEIMQPELEKVKKQCGDNQQLFVQKQREVYKKYKYSMFGACLPSLVTMVIFFVIFSGFNSSVRHHNSVVYDEMQAVYTTAYTTEINAQIAQYEGGVVPANKRAEVEAAGVQKAEEAVLAAYKPEKFLHITNIFMPDSWKQPIPDASTYAGSGMGKLGIPDVDREEYSRVMKPIMDKYNYTEKGKKQWNGYLVLPILTLALSLISSKLLAPAKQPTMPGQTEEQIKQQERTNKIMMLMMPLMMGVFSLFYSAAFTLYMFTNSLFTTVFNVTYNLIAKRVDAKARDHYLSTTLK
jgi:YidC/Oxa1 family membrane protein insertase